MSISTADTTNRLVLYGVSWDQYSRLIEVLGDRHLRHTYDSGTLEIMSPGKTHERLKGLLSRMVEDTSRLMKATIQFAGSTTLRQDAQSKALEPDVCYYIANEPIVRDKDDYDPERDPPPDLAIEIDITNSSVSRLTVYRSLGVPEVWRITDDTVRFMTLSHDQGYVEVSRSASFPVVTPDMVESIIGRRKTADDNKLLDDFAALVRSRMGSSPPT